MEYTQLERIRPFLCTLLRRVPSNVNPAFSSTRREARLHSNGSAYMRTMSKDEKASAQI